MAPLAALVSVFVAAAIPAAAGSGALRVVSDVAACPSPGEVQSALRQALGQGEQRSAGWTLWYGRDLGLPLAEREASLLMELADPSGERVVSRRIPTPASDCSAIGTAMAAVVERSLRDLGWTRDEPLPDSAAATKPVEPTGASAAPSTSAQRAPSTESAESRAVPRLLLGAGPAFGTSSRLGTNLLLDARVRIAGPVCLRLGALAFAGSSSESVPSSGIGRATLSSRTFALNPLAAFVVAPVELAVGPVLLLAIDGVSSSNLPRVGSGTRLVMAAGAGGGAAFPLSKRWRLGVDVQAVRVAFAPDTYVEWNGATTKVLVPAPWQAMVAGKLEFVPWP